MKHETSWSARDFKLPHGLMQPMAHFYSLMYCLMYFNRMWLTLFPRKTVPRFLFQGWRIFLGQSCGTISDSLSHTSFCHNKMGNLCLR